MRLFYTTCDDTNINYNVFIQAFTYEHYWFCVVPPTKNSEYPREFGIKPGCLLLSQDSLDKIIYGTYFLKHFTCIPFTSSATLQLETGKEETSEEY